MKFKDTPLRTLRRRAYCDSCGSELVGTGQGITKFNTSWEHACLCDDKTWIDHISYPCEMTEEIKRTYKHKVKEFINTRKTK